MNSSAPIQLERLNVPIANQEFAHLLRLTTGLGKQQAVFMLHGLMDNASCFYNPEQQTGLAFTLAKQGYDVYLGELRGRYLDNTSLKDLSLTVDSAITQDLTGLINTMHTTAKPEQQIWIGQGFGCVLLASYLARYPQQLHKISTLVHFSPFRASQPVGTIKNLWVNWVHKRGLSLLTKNLGYVPALKLKLGRSNESLGFYQQALNWLHGPWQGADGFNYAAAVENLDWPPSLYFASLHQSWRGSHLDARAFMFDFAPHNARLIKIGGKGRHKNYKRAELCLSPLAEQDYYPFLLSWLGDLNLKAAT